MKIFNLILLSTIICLFTCSNYSFNYLELNYVKIQNISLFDNSDDSISHDENIKKDVELLHEIENNYKRFACLSIIRNSLNEGNIKIKDVIKNTLHNESDTFDKILLLMLNNCEIQIDKNEINQVFYKKILLKKHF